MSSRVTRSSAKKPAESSLSLPHIAASQPEQTSPTITSRKRKASSNTPATRGTPDSDPSPPSTSRRQSKRTKHIHQDLPVSVPRLQGQRRAKASDIMSTPSDTNEPSAENNASASAGSSSRRKSSKGKKSPPDYEDTSPPLSLKRTRPASSRKRASSSNKKNETPTESQAATKAEPQEEDDDDDEDADDLAADEDAHNEDDEDDDMDEDPFGAAAFLGRGGPLGLSSTLRAISGMVSGMTSRMRDLLEKLRQKDDPSIQFIALQELSEILLISTEDNLAGHLSPDQYAKEFVTLMQPPEFGEENPEMMLLACRCIANLMEALPASTAAVVYNGAVPVLLQSLLAIQYMDLAEQALITLEKISSEFPAAIVREGGLMACLSYLDFFATSVQRTAVTTAANCCRNIPEEAFDSVKEVMPILLNILNNNDQRVVEQGCLCISRIVESFRYQDDKLETLMSADLLRAILRLLSPSATNLIGPNIHTQFLRVLSITARASSALSAELFKMNVVDTLYQILTGVSPPGDEDDAAQKIDSVVVMQALIHRPRDQVFETLNVVCELLPGLDKEGMGFIYELYEHSGPSGDRTIAQNGASHVTRRRETLKECKAELRRFAVVLFPTLTDAYSSTVNLSVRQKVLSAQLKMLSNLDTDILEEALRAVPYASFLASILSQQDHPFLVTAALQAAELLLKRLENTYGYQFYREGVIAEVKKLAERPLQEQPKDSSDRASSPATSAVIAQASENPSKGSRDEGHPEEDEPAEPLEAEEQADDEEAEFIDENHDDEDEDAEDDDDDESSEESQGRHPAMNASPTASIQDMITKFAKKFVEKYESVSGRELQVKATKILDDLQGLVSDISDCYYNGRTEEAAKLFTRLAKYFEGDALESITSYELLTSKVVGTLLDIFQDNDLETSRAAQAAFIEVFMGSQIKRGVKTASSSAPLTAFSVLVQKLQDLLSRAEHFEVVTVHQNAFESNRTSAASMLAKQIRVKLVAQGDESGIPASFRSIMVSIHAIATFKALDDYLRPRITLAERPRRHRDGSDGTSPFGFERAFAEHLAGAGALNNLPGSSTTPPPREEPEPRSASSRKSSKAKAPSTPAADPSPGGSQEDVIPKPSTRRSSRKSTKPALAQDGAGEDMSGALECADEDHVEDDDDLDDDDEMDAIVDDLEEEFGSSQPDPSSVNMEVASTGRVTARSEHGTRISTPTQTAPPAQQPASYRSSASYSLARQVLAGMPGRLGSYAAAVQATPQDWHLEFSVNGLPISNDTTIYRAVHNNQAPGGDSSGRNAWSTLHSISFKRVQGPPPAEPNTLNPPSETQAGSGKALPVSLNENPITADILRLLKIMHEMNSNLDEVLTENRLAITINAEPLGQFVNTKLTAKLNRQLEEPLIVASNCLPSWSEDLARLYPFLFPFETRHLFLQSTSFGYSRSMNRWQNAQSSSDSRRDRHRDERPFLGRLQRQKVRISRHKILESALKVMELYGASPSVLEVEYFEEVGTGLGPTLEFYSNVSKEFSKKKLCLWRENDSSEKDAYAYGKRGLFPAPMSEAQLESENGQKVLTLFKMLGKFVARSMLDSRIIDISFNPAFFRVNINEDSDLPTLGAVKAVDESLATSLQTLRQLALSKKKVEDQDRLTPQQKAQKISRIQIGGVSVDDMGLDFTLPGYPNIELIPNGADVNVTIDNVGDYVDKVIDFTLARAVRKQVKAFREGFSQVFPYSALSAFTPDELVMLFGRVDEDWSLETLLDSVKADHGYNMDSKSVRNLLQTMSELSAPQRREFLQFVTGSPKLPIGGFKALTPMLTVVLRPAEPGSTPDASLPSVMTCQNYVKLPDYSSPEVMRARLNMAVKEGAGAFHLS